MDRLARCPRRTMSNTEAIDIFVFSNGQEYSPPRKYHLSIEELNCWDFTLAYLARLQYGPRYSKIELYSVSGHQVHSPLELRDGTAYVSVVPPDCFKNTGYNKYLIKASRSWEKRQRRRLEIHALSKEKMIQRESNPLNTTKQSCDVTKRIRPGTYCKRICNKPFECMKPLNSPRNVDEDSQPSSTNKSVSQRNPIKIKDSNETAARSTSKSPGKTVTQPVKYGQNKVPLKTVTPKKKTAAPKKDDMSETKKDDNPAAPKKDDLIESNKDNNADTKNTTDFIITDEEKSIKVEEKTCDETSCAKIKLARELLETVTVSTKEDDKNDVHKDKLHNINDNEKLSQHSIEKDDISIKELLSSQQPIYVYSNTENKIKTEEIPANQADNTLKIKHLKNIIEIEKIETEISNQLMNLSDTHNPVVQLNIEKEKIDSLADFLVPQRSDKNQSENPFTLKPYSTNEIFDETQCIACDNNNCNKITTQTQQLEKTEEPIQDLFKNDENADDSHFLECDGDTCKKIDNTEICEMGELNNIPTKNNDTLVIDKMDTENHNNSQTCAETVKGVYSDKFTTYIQKGDILNLKLTIEVRNNDTTSSDKMEKESQANLVLSRTSFSKLGNNEPNKTFLLETVTENDKTFKAKYSKIIVIQCLCSPNNEIQIIPKYEGDDRKLLLIPAENIEEIRCKCEHNGAKNNVLKSEINTTTNSINPGPNDTVLLEKESLRVQQMVANFEQNMKTQNNSLEFSKMKLSTKVPPNSVQEVSGDDIATSTPCSCKIVDKAEIKTSVTVEDTIKIQSISKNDTIPSSKTESIYLKRSSSMKEINFQDTKNSQDKTDESIEKQNANDCTCQCHCEGKSKKQYDVLSKVSEEKHLEAEEKTLNDENKNIWDDLDNSKKTIHKLTAESKTKSNADQQKQSRELKSSTKCSSTQQNPHLVSRKNSTSELKDIKCYADKNEQTDWGENILEAKIEDDGRYTLYLPSLETLRRYNL